MKVPENVVFFSRPVRSVQLMDGTTVEAMDTYPAYEASKARMKSGLKWAEEGAYEYTGWGAKAKKKKLGDVTQATHPNRFDGLTILSLEKRGEGGRAYKTIMHGCVFDLREDTLLDIFANVGIQKGGHVDAEFCFVGSGTEFKIMRIDSPAYKAMVAEDEKFSRQPVKQFEVGHIYENAHYEYLYMGEVWVDEFEFVKKSGIFDSYYTHRIYHGNSAHSDGYNLVEKADSKPYKVQIWLRSTDEIKPASFGFYCIELTKGGKRFATGRTMKPGTIDTTEKFLDMCRSKRREGGWLYLVQEQLRNARFTKEKPNNA